MAPTSLKATVFSYPQLEPGGDQPLEHSGIYLFIHSFVHSTNGELIAGYTSMDLVLPLLHPGQVTSAGLYHEDS